MLAGLFLGKILRLSSVSLNLPFCTTFFHQYPHSPLILPWTLLSKPNALGSTTIPLGLGWLGVYPSQESLPYKRNPERRKPLPKEWVSNDRIPGPVAPGWGTDIGCDSTHIPPCQRLPPAPQALEWKKLLLLDWIPLTGDQRLEKTQRKKIG